MNPAVFELAVSEDGTAAPGRGVLAAFVPANADFPPLVVAGCDPRHDPGKPIETLAGPVFAYINRSLGRRPGVRWVVVDNWGRFFDAAPHWAADADTSPILEFKRFANGVGVDAFTKDVGPAGEAGLELLSAVIEGSNLTTAPTSVRQFLEAIQAHGNLPAPGALFHAVSTAAVTGDIRAATQAIQLDPVISATLINYANAAAFANAGKTGSIAEAIQRLGINQVRRVVFVAEMMARYQKGACADFEYRSYWHNAIATAAAMRGLMAEFGIPERLADDGFTAGLLSGIGWLAIAETFPGLMADYTKRARNADPIAKTRLQQEIFPGPVSRVTETYLARFDFPETVLSAIGGQPTRDGWAWFDCLAAAIRASQGLAPFDCLAVPTGLPVPEACREEWLRWKSLLAIPSAISS
jgi:HD-like signal output (HDOD) protein